MKKAWQDIDLCGAGLQTANQAITAQLKRRRVAYVLLALFPLGLHRFYLEDRRGARLYPLAVTAAALLPLFVAGRIGLYLGAVLLALVILSALRDLRWIDDRVAEINKRIRMRALLRPDHPPPEGFRGRYTDDGNAGTAPEAGLADYLAIKEEERAGHQPVGKGTGKAPGRAPSRIPSFAEQERLLREMTKGKENRN